MAALPEDAVHVWITFPDAIDDAALLGAYDGLMTEEERRKQQRFYFAKGRHECLVTRALVRTVLSRYAPVEPAAWRFVSNAHGRPEIAPEHAQPGLRFNLSHTDGLIACAVTRGRDVGVDVEATDRPGETVEIADRFFSPHEVGALRALPASRQRARFFDYWTLKESYIKARGTGLALPLDRFSFHLENAPPIRISFDPRLDDDPDSWQFAQLDPTPRHRLAVGVRRGRAPDLRIEVRQTVPLR